jgi:hypothetical protein
MTWPFQGQNAAFNPARNSNPVYPIRSSSYTLDIGELGERVQGLRPISAPADTLAMPSAQEPWSLPASLAFLAVCLFCLLVVLAATLASIALICGASIAARIGYGAMLARLEKDDPNSTLLQGSWQMITWTPVR